MADGNSTNTDLAYADTLWKSADALRGQVDAAEYKHVVLGLLFLKYISDAFDARREELKVELEAEGITGPQMEALLENRDEYTAERVFWVPPEARWANLQNQATRPDIATLIDDAILAVERDNPNLKGKLPRDYARRGIEPVKLKGLIDLIADIGFKGGRAKARDTLGRVYEYFLGKFAQAEGKLGGEFYTPRCVVRLLVEMLEPYEGRVYDPCCGSGGMFVQSERFVEAHGGGVAGFVMANGSLSSNTGGEGEIRQRIVEADLVDAIVGVLDALDDKIEQNRRTARTLERLAQAIFRAWFVDFEPVKAKAAGVTSFPSMPQLVFDSLPNRLVDSEIGLVPEGWELKPISVTFDVNPTRVLRKGDVAPYLDMKNMPTEGHAPESWIEREVGSGIKFINGDTLVARITPCLENGKTAFVDFLPNGQVGWGSTEYIVLRPKPPLPALFGYCLARTAEFRDYAIQNMSGTSGRQRVAPVTMDHFKIAVPTEDAAIGFGEIVQPIFDRIRAGMNESRKLAELRDLLLPKLLSGQVRVHYAERVTEKAM